MLADKINSVYWGSNKFFVYPTGIVDFIIIVAFGFISSISLITYSIDLVLK